jgi:DNA recombination protein RmuC
MNSLSILMLALAIISAALGGVVAWLVLRTRSAVLREQVSTLGQTLTAAQEELKTANLANSNLRAEVAGLNSTLQEERKTGEEKIRLLNSASAELRPAFQALAAEALRSNNESFLDLAKTRLENYQAEAKGDLEARQKAVEGLVTPIKESLNKVDAQIQKIENERSQAYGSLTAQVGSLIDTQNQLRGETGNLVKALRDPAVSGRWGEFQLRKVVEIAGMLHHCDFEEQVSVKTADGPLRPDMVVKLSGGKNIVVDAKTPTQDYMDAAQTTDDEVRKAKLLEHAQKVRAHMGKLGLKSYFEQFQPAPEFVVMFIPGENFFSAALAQQPDLIEYGVNKRIILASPITLIAILKGIAYGWDQEELAENAQKISKLGKELHERLRTFASHLGNLGEKLNGAVQFYNDAVGSLESRVLVSARRFSELKAASPLEIPELVPIETTTRTLALLRAEAEDRTAEENSGEDSSR